MTQSTVKNNELSIKARSKARKKKRWRASYFSQFSFTAQTGQIKNPAGVQTICLFIYLLPVKRGANNMAYRRIWRN